MGVLSLLFRGCPPHVINENGWMGLSTFVDKKLLAEIVQKKRENEGGKKIRQKNFGGTLTHSFTFRCSFVFVIHEK